MPSTIDSYATTDVDDLFNQHTLVQSEGAVDPLADIFGITGQSEPEYYDVDDTPLPEEDGVLRLKMPIARPMTMNRSEEPDGALPICVGVSVHMGYIPIKEEEAFENTVSEHSLQASRFTIPRGRMSVGQIIDYIRKVVFASDDIHEIAPKNTHYIPITHQDRILYSSTLFYATFDQYGNHRFAQFNIRLQPVKDKEVESIAVVATHFQGDTRLSMEFFLTLRAYVLSKGTSECKVHNPGLFNGFADQYIDDMSEPATLTMFAEVDEE
jgi:hypothetical protein